METSSCDGLRIKEKVDFEVELTLTKCPEKGQSIKPIIINAQGLGERVVVNVDAICDCDCEKKQEQTGVSDYCNKRGKVVCGICECDPQYYGNKCECSTLDSDTAKGNNISSCIK